MMICDMILHWDDNIVMSLELLPPLITCILNTEVNLVNLVNLVSPVNWMKLMNLMYLMCLMSYLLLRCVCCFMYAAMYAVKLCDVLSINVNMLEVAFEWSVHPLLAIPNLIYSEPS